MKKKMATQTTKIPCKNWQWTPKSETIFGPVRQRRHSQTAHTTTKPHKVTLCPFRSINPWSKLKYNLVLILLSPSIKIHHPSIGLISEGATAPCVIALIRLLRYSQASASALSYLAGGCVTQLLWKRTQPMQKALRASFKMQQMVRSDATAAELKMFGVWN